MCKAFDHVTTSFVFAQVGSGCFAMAHAIKHGGIVVGPILLLIIGVICVHLQHVLINCANFVKEQKNMHLHPDYAETIKLSFLMSKNPMWKRCGKYLKASCNFFLCVTQLGLCSVYFMSVSRNLKSFLEHFGYKIDIHVLIAIVLVPILLTSLIRTLKFIG